MKWTKIAALISALFAPAITTPKTFPDPIPGIEQAGGMIPNGAMVAALAAFQAAAAPTFGNWGATVIPASTAAATYGAPNMVQGLILRLSTGGTVINDCTDTATNIIAAIPGAKPLQTFPLFVANMNSSTGVTMRAGTGVTIAGSGTIGGLSCRLFLGQVTGSAAVTITGLFSLSMGSGL